MRIGLIADTHGLMRPEALAALRGCDHILHAGDIGAPAVLHALATLAPITAIRGNNDTADWAHALPDAITVEIGGVAIHLLHDLNTLKQYAPRGDVAVIVAGHSHRPIIDRPDGRLVVNPGSAGRRRFSLPVTVGELRIADGRAQATIVPLAIAG
jgi:putative phosphoesterase